MILLINLNISFKYKNIGVSVKKIKLFIYFILASLFFTGCIDINDSTSYKSTCKKPRYMSYKDLRADYPAVKKPKEIDTAGKIYVFGDILLINERNQGIHVIDNRVKETPIAKKFIEIPGNIDLAVKDGYLYVDSFIDLVVLNINDINNITVVDRKEEVFPYNHLQALSEEDLDKYRCYPDENKGVVVGYK